VFDHLDEWVPRVYRFALRLCGDAHAAEDVAQEALVRAWRRRGRLRNERAARVWVFRIALNVWRDRLRRGALPVGRAGPLEGTETIVGPSAERLAEMREDLARALAALDGLPPRQREVLYLSAVEGLSASEVADVLGISSVAAKANLSLARQKMREQLPDVFPSPAPVE
jgi:RNA polymerase sigma-70 factor (ECF subfamily)